MHGKHEFVGSNPTQANILYAIFAKNASIAF